eukprot:CAMPEP_0198597790 /NCGR_PEP_ID=MMETSP1462-20131121/144877_1 /TAXON_ID=1333877 /ORGANISM="Brandtodinium nutriculum, Strain RCC3387" /LENGTH=146 /DNA_ID=CAMNT_0044329453 /DNA_START=92 /DNA_END=530 /DNA_ORIENTATION=+
MWSATAGVVDRQTRVMLADPSAIWLNGGSSRESDLEGIVMVERVDFWSNLSACTCLLMDEWVSTVWLWMSDKSTVSEGRIFICFAIATMSLSMSDKSTFSEGRTFISFACGYCFAKSSPSLTSLWDVGGLLTFIANSLSKSCSSSN